MLKCYPLKGENSMNTLLLFLLIAGIALSPILAAVFGAMLYRTSKKARRFAEKLYFEGRITLREFFEATGQARAPLQNEKGEAPTQAALGPQAGEKTPPPSAQASYRPPSSPNPEVAVKQKRSDGALPLVLAIGVAFIAIAGVIFVTSSWNTLSGWSKIGLMMAVAAAFFGAFAAARFHLKLSSTARAFYILGCGALASAVLASEFLGILEVGASLGARGAAPVAVLSLALCLGGFWAKDRLFLFLGWVAAFVASHFLSLWVIHANFAGYEALFGAPSAILASLLAIYATLFRPGLLQDRHAKLFIFGSFAAGTLVSAAAGAFSRSGSTAAQAVAAVAMLFCAIAVAAAAERGGMRFLLYVQPFALSWAASLLAGAAIRPQPGSMEYMAGLRAAAVAAMLLGAYLHSLHAIPKRENAALLAHSAVYPAFALFEAASQIQYGQPMRFFIVLAYAVSAIGYCLLFASQGGLASFKGSKAAHALAVSAFVLAACTYSAECAPANQAAVFQACAAFLFLILAFCPFPGKKAGSLGRLALAFALCLIGALCVPTAANLANWSMWQSLYCSIALAIAIAGAWRAARGSKSSAAWLSSAYALALYLVYRAMTGIASLEDPPAALVLQLRPMAVYTAAGIALALASFLSKPSGGRPSLPLRITAVGSAIASAGFCLFLALGGGSLFAVAWDISFAALAAMGAFGCYILYSREKTHWDILCAFSFYYGARITFAGVLGSGGEWIAVAAPGLAIAATASLAFALGLKRKGFAWLRAVWAAGCLEAISKGLPSDDWHFIGLSFGLLLSLNFLQHLMDGGKSRRDKILLTFSAFAATASVAIWIARMPVTLTGIQGIRAEMTAFTLIFGAFAASWLVWRFSPLSRAAVFAVSAGSAIMLFFSANSRQLLNTSLFTAAALAALGFSLHSKSGRWFALGLLSVLAVFVRETSTFWLGIKWWAYLLAIGLSLVAFAALNESARRKGESLKGQLKARALKGWTW
jgi:hypothetical protein